MTANADGAVALTTARCFSLPKSRLMQIPRFSAFGRDSMFRLWMSPNLLRRMLVNGNSERFAVRDRSIQSVRSLSVAPQ